MSTIGLTPAPHGADLTVDGTPIASITLRGDDAEIAMAPVGHPGVSWSRQHAPSSGQSGVTLSGDTVTAAYPGTPDVSLTRVTPDAEPNTATPSGVPDLHGQDEALHALLWSMHETLNDPKRPIHTLITGPTGCGKTVMCRKAAELAGWSFVMASVDPDTTKGDLLGEHLPASDGDTMSIPWVPGPVERAVRRSQTHPTLLLLDEPNRAVKSSIFASMYPVLDGTRSLQMPGGDRVDVGTLVVVAAANPADDDRTQYEVRELDPAFADRFQQTLTVTYPAPDVEATALCEQVPGLPFDTAKALTETAAAVRSSREVTYPFGFRTLEAWARKVSCGYDPYAAAEQTFVPKAPADEREALRNYVQSFIPKGA